MAADPITMPMAEPMHAQLHVEEVRVPRITAAKMFLRRNQELIIVLTAIAASVWVTRALVRKDIKNINFTAEFYPDWMYDDDGTFVGIGSD